MVVESGCDGIRTVWNGVRAPKFHSVGERHALGDLGEGDGDGEQGEVRYPLRGGDWTV